jgi:hypothetical protein
MATILSVVPTRWNCEFDLRVSRGRRFAMLMEDADVAGASVRGVANANERRRFIHGSPTVEDPDGRIAA